MVTPALIKSDPFYPTFFLKKNDKKVGEMKLSRKNQSSLKIYMKKFYKLVTMDDLENLPSGSSFSESCPFIQGVYRLLAYI